MPNQDPNELFFDGLSHYEEKFGEENEGIEDGHDSDSEESVEEQDEDVKIDFKEYFGKFKKIIPKYAGNQVITYEGFLLKTLLNMIESNDQPDVVYTIKEQLIK